MRISYYHSKDLWAAEMEALSRKFPEAEDLSKMAFENVMKTKTNEDSKNHSEQADRKMESAR